MAGAKKAGAKKARVKQAGAKTAGYKLATYKSSDGPRAGIIIGEDVFDAAKLTGKAAYATVIGILEDWKAADALIRKAAAGAAKSRAKRQPLKKTKLLAPVRFPSAIYCAGANYADHAAAMAAREGNPPPADPHDQGLKPWHFLKAARTTIWRYQLARGYALCYLPSDRFQTLAALIGLKSPGNTVAVQIRRGSEAITLKVVLGKRPA